MEATHLRYSAKELEAMDECGDRAVEKECTDKAEPQLLPMIGRCHLHVVWYMIVHDHNAIKLNHTN